MYRNRALFWLGIIVIISGLFFVFVSYLDFGKNILLIFSASYSATSEINETGWKLLNALTSIMGAVMVGWGVTIIYLSNNYSRLTQKYVIIGLVSWFLLDSLGSLLWSFEYNVLLNAAFLILGVVAAFWPNIKKITLN